MLVTVPGMLYNSLSALYAIIIVLSALNKTSFSYMNDFDSILKEPFQPANGFPSTLITLSGMLMLLRDSHSENADFPIVFTLSEMLMLVSDLHLRNAQSPILVTLSGMLMLARDLHLKKVVSPMLVTLFGMLILVSELHQEYLLLVDYQYYTL